MRGVGSKKSKQLELKYRSLINKLGHEHWSKDATSFDVATPAALADALRAAVAAMAKKERDPKGRWSLASSSLSLPTGRSSSGGVVVVGVAKQRWGGSLGRGGCVFEQTDLEITSPEWGTAGVQRWRSMAFEKSITMEGKSSVRNSFGHSLDDPVTWCKHRRYSNSHSFANTLRC
jgi:hypothetical protein